jgi:hypothetical protein
MQESMLRVETPLDATYVLSERGLEAAERGVYDIAFEEYKAATDGAG